MNRARRLVGALVCGAAVCTLVACGSSSEGTVVAKSGQASYDHACQAGGTVTGPVAVPAEQAVHTLEVLDAARLSAAENRVVELPPD